MAPVVARIFFIVGVLEDGHGIVSGAGIKL